MALLSCDEARHLSPALSTDDRTCLQQFTQSPAPATWNNLDAMARKAPDSRTGKIVLAVERFTEASLQRDLPNSMAQNGDPNEHQRATALEAERQFLSLRPFVGDELWQVTVALLNQNFDDGYYHACGEIVVRLFPSRYSSLRQQLTDDKSLILYREYLRWGAAEPPETFVQ